jgi:hypothetical protein
MMRHLQYLAIALIVLLGSINTRLNAQFTGSNTCIDSLAITFNQCYGTIYQPVCGCNVTYRNECNAIAAGIVNFGYTEGPCEFMDFDILQTRYPP